MKEKKVIISGANGYFGSIGCQYFESQGWQVLKACRQNNADIFLDLNYPETFANLKISTDCNLFIHAAAAHEVLCHQSPYLSIFHNIVGTKSALDFCVNNNIEYFIYLSTFHVFGHPQGQLDESTEPLPNNDYGISHLQAEQYVQMYIRAGKIKGMILRPSNFFGIPASIDQCKRWTLVPLSFCREAVENHRIVLKTSGLQERNFVSVLDACRVIESAHLLGYSVPILHIVGVSKISILAFAQLIQKIIKIHLNKEIEVIIPKTLSSQSFGASETFNYDSKYLKEFYQPKDRIEDFITDFCKLLQSQLNC